MSCTVPGDRSTVVSAGDAPGSPRPAVLAGVDRRLLASIELTVLDARITRLHADGDPNRLAALLAGLS